MTFVVLGDKVYPSSSNEILDDDSSSGVNQGSKRAERHRVEVRAGTSSSLASHLRLAHPY